MDLEEKPDPRGSSARASSEAKTQSQSDGVYLMQPEDAKRVQPQQWCSQMLQIRGIASDAT